jgi:hypothetical protein
MAWPQPQREQQLRASVCVRPIIHPVPIHIHIKCWCWHTLVIGTRWQHAKPPPSAQRAQRACLRACCLLARAAAPHTMRGPTSPHQPTSATYHHHVARPTSTYPQLPTIATRSSRPTSPAPALHSGTTGRAMCNVMLDRYSILDTWIVVLLVRECKSSITCMPFIDYKRVHKRTQRTSDTRRHGVESSCRETGRPARGC